MYTLLLTDSLVPKLKFDQQCAPTENYYVTLTKLSKVNYKTIPMKPRNIANANANDVYTCFNRVEQDAYIVGPLQGI